MGWKWIFKKVGKITIKTDGKIISELIDEIPLFDGYTSYYTVTRRNVTRYVDKETYIFIEDIIQSHAHEFDEVLAHTEFDLPIDTIK